MLFDKQFELALKEHRFMSFFSSWILVLSQIHCCCWDQERNSSLDPMSTLGQINCLLSSTLLCFVKFGAAEPLWFWKCQNSPHSGANSICSHSQTMPGCLCCPDGTGLAPHTVGLGTFWDIFTNSCDWLGGRLAERWKKSLPWYQYSSGISAAPHLSCLWRKI